MATPRAAASQKKSGIKSFKSGEVIFNEKDVAESLFIIQRGQIRLFSPKGKGFVDVAILRAGEVIGEMAYFDEKSRRRSCSAAAIVSTEVIEISFPAFAKTMGGLNPWFKTIINTLANRLRKTNERVKELESNSVGFSSGGRPANYKFFHSVDIIRLLSLFYMGTKTHGIINEGKYEIHLNKLRFYMVDVFNIQEVKYEEFLQMLKIEHFLEFSQDKDGQPKLIRIPSIDVFRGCMVFFNTQRVTEDSKKLIISSKCERFLKRILDQLALSKADVEVAMVDISAILDDFKSRGVPVTQDDLVDAVKADLCQDVMVAEGNKMAALVNYKKLRDVFPAIKMMNALNKINDSKAKIGKYTHS
jgi:CRP/FNR family cyclic AMP-dependent transcriptional regulator